jgi:hypothetical protein
MANLARLDLILKGRLDMILVNQITKLKRPIFNGKASRHIKNLVMTCLLAGIWYIVAGIWN